METQQLISAALAARGQAYAPYSGFAVGAALLCADTKIYTGCNIESASYSPANCAERTAFFKAVSDGEREFCAIAIVGGPKGCDIEEFCPPCGVCRQVMAEFCGDDFIIILAKSEDDYQTYTLKELLPLRFGREQLTQHREGNIHADV